MKPLIKELLREELNEISLKNAVAGGMMALGSMGAAKAQTAPVTPAPTTQTTTTTTTTAPKPMFGTKEERAAAKAKREAQRKKNEDIFIMGAIRAGFYEEVSEEEYSSGCQAELADTNEYKDVVYRTMVDTGAKFKVNLKKYRKYIEKMGKQPEVGLDGLQSAEFTSTSCGISKQHAKDDKKDWSKK